MPNPYRLSILCQLREAVGLTQRDMARLCGLRGRQSHQTAGGWERGTITPAASRRTRFIGYLWDHLRLREDIEQFEEVWAILVEEWNWEPISDAEWASFTHQQRRHGQQPDAGLPGLSQPEARSSVAPEAVLPSPDPSSLSSQFQPGVLPLDKLPEPGPLPPGSKMPFARNPLFVGREADLLALASALTVEQTAAVTQVTAAATGLGGIGKTQLASEFVHRYGRYFTGGVFWLNFDEATTISTEVASCGGPGSMDLRPDFVTRPLHEQVQLVKAAWQEPVPRLLVFDNCEDPELLVRWRPTSGGCRVLVTSRRLDWDLAIGVQVYALDVLNRQDSLKLLTRYDSQANRDTLNAIAEELGDLPLALHLAASYLHRYRRVVTPEQYLAQLRHPPLLAHPSLQGKGISPTGHIQHVGRTFALSYDRLDRADPVDAQALQLLMCLSLLAPGEPAPYELLAETLGIDLAEPQQAVNFEDAVVRLAELGLIDVHDARQLRIHRLLAAFVRESAPAHVPDAQTQVEAIVQRKLDENYLDENYQIKSALTLLPIQAHVHHVVEAALIRQDPQSATLSHALARYLWQLGSFAAAEKYAERGLAIRQQIYGELHADTAVSHHLLGILRQKTQAFDQAQEHLQKALGIQLELTGEYHFNTADILVNIAELHWTQQRLPEAIGCLQHALAICDEAVEEDHPLVAQLTMTLALCLHDGGRDSQQARYYMEEALRIRRERFGDQHPYTATVYMNMGYLLREMGQLEEADQCYQRGLAIRQQTLGEKHVETAHSLFSLGKLRRAQGELDTAQQYLEQALEILLLDQGEMYYLAASCRHELGAILLSRGEPARARPYLEQALAVRQAIYHADHPHVISTRQVLQQVLEAEQTAKANTMRNSS